MSADYTTVKNAKYFRQIAWEKNTGKWGKLVVITLIVSAIYGLCGVIGSIFRGAYIGQIIWLFIFAPLSLGSAYVSLAVIRKDKFGVDTLFDGFKNYGNAFVLGFVNSIFIFLWSLLLVVPGIIKAYSYALSYYILADNPRMTPSEARKKSVEMMEGNKWRLFCLEISFIGWWLLCILTFGILSLWVQPYLQTAVAEFYESLLPPKSYETPTENSAPKDNAADGDKDKPLTIKDFGKTYETNSKEASALTIEERFNISYTAAESVCNDAFKFQYGIAQYINELEKRTDCQKQNSPLHNFYQKLIKCKRIHSELANRQNVADLCESDIDALDRLCDSILNKNDPLGTLPPIPDKNGVPYTQSKPVLKNSEPYKQNKPQWRNAQTERDEFWDCFDKYLNSQGNPFYVTHVKGGKNQAAGNINNPDPMAMQTLCCQYRYKDQEIWVLAFIDHKVELYNYLYAKKDEIEENLGYEVDWIDRGPRASSVRIIKKSFKINKSYGEMVREVFPYILDFIRVFEPYLKAFVD